MVPKFVQILPNFGSICGSARGSLGRPLDPKNLKNIYVFFKVFGKTVFWLLNLLIALLGSSWPLLGPICSQNDFQNLPKSSPKSNQKRIQKMTPILLRNKLILSPKMDAKFVQNGDGGAHENLAGAILEALGPKMPPRCPKIGSNKPR